ncbi:MAG: hypothetical protein HQK50_07450 [Oligoflexia bacterium]|nr:hypothetical protein [Oligoflexia bacterium]
MKTNNAEEHELLMADEFCKTEKSDSSSISNFDQFSSDYADAMVSNYYDKSLDSSSYDEDVKSAMASGKYGMYKANISGGASKKSYRDAEVSEQAQMHSDLKTSLVHSMKKDQASMESLFSQNCGRSAYAERSKKAATLAQQSGSSVITRAYVDCVRLVTERLVAGDKLTMETLQNGLSTTLVREDSELFNLLIFWKHQDGDVTIPKLTIKYDPRALTIMQATVNGSLPPDNITVDAVTSNGRSLAKVIPIKKESPASESSCAPHKNAELNNSGLTINGVKVIDAKGN